MVAALLLTAAPGAQGASLDYWEGFYLGGNVGYSWGSARATINAALFPSSSFTSNANGALGGFQAGYNWLLAPRWLAGLESDIQITGQRGSATDSVASAQFLEFGGDFFDVFTRTASTEVKLPWFATFRGRFGYLADPLTLLYATGGLALGRIAFSSSVSVTCSRFNPFDGTPAGSPCVPPVGAPTVGSTSFSDNATRVGWTIGAGIERKLAEHWSIKLEYLYIDFGTATFLSGTGNDTSIHLRDNIVRAGVNWVLN